MLTRRGWLSRISISLKKAEQPARSREPHITVALRDGVTASAPAGYRDIIAQLAELRHPAYVEIENGVIRTLLIPIPYRVVCVAPVAEKGVDVILEISHATHELLRDHPRFEELLRLLREAQTTGQVVLVTERPASNEIIDVAAILPESSQSRLLPGERSEAAEDIRKSKGNRGFRSRTYDAKSAAAAADDLFKFLAGQPQIPFKYPRDGCWARANEMSRLLSTKKVPSRKIWLYRAYMKVFTLNDPACYVVWRFHVAPVVELKRTNGTFMARVMDPSLFDKPVSTAQWERLVLRDLEKHHQLLQNPACRIMTPSQVYYRNCDGGDLRSDSDYKETEKDLKAYSLALATQMQQHGPPPYECPKAR